MTPPPRGEPDRSRPSPAELLSGAGHGLLNRLTSISLAAETAELALEKQQPAQALRLIHRLQENIGSFQQMVKDLLLSNRLLESRQMLEFSAWEAPFLREWTNEVLRPHPEADRRRVVLELAGGPLVRADRTIVPAVLGHLLGNALKFSAPQGVVEVRLEARADGLGITVSDPGIGIPPAELTRIGEPFYRASNVGGRGGLGLGLFIVQGIAALHGGSMQVTARPQGGTRVHVELPAPPDGAPTPSDAPAPSRAG